MVASNNKVVSACQVFERDLFCIYIMTNHKKDGSKYSTIIYPNHNSFSRLTPRKTQAFEIRCWLKFSLASQKFTQPRHITLTELKIDLWLTPYFFFVYIWGFQEKFNTKVENLQQKLLHLITYSESGTIIWKPIVMETRHLHSKPIDRFLYNGNMGLEWDKSRAI